MEKSGVELSGKLEQVLGDLENAITKSVAAMRVNSSAVIQEDTCCTESEQNERAAGEKQIVRANITPPYSLHDMNVIAFEVAGDSIIMRTQSGMIKTEGLSSQVDGHVIFENVQWDFSYVYLLDFTGNIGTFTGEKMFLKDFIAGFQNAGFSVMDETFGYNQSRFTGYLSMNRTVKECSIEIYHEGSMIYVEEA